MVSGGAPDGGAHPGAVARDRLGVATVANGPDVGHDLVTTCLRQGVELVAGDGVVFLGPGGTCPWAVRGGPGCLHWRSNLCGRGCSLDRSRWSRRLRRLRCALLLQALAGSRVVLGNLSLTLPLSRFGLGLLCPLGLPLLVGLTSREPIPGVLDPLSLLQGGGNLPQVGNVLVLDVGQLERLPVTGVQGVADITWVQIGLIQFVGSFAQGRGCAATVVPLGQ